jgi:hypothetical protein
MTGIVDEFLQNSYRLREIADTGPRTITRAPWLAQPFACD